MEKLKKPIVKETIANLTYLILVVVYFICFNTQGSILDSVALSIYIDISSMVFLTISIIMFELGYRNNKTEIFINGIEFLVLAISTLLIKHMPKALGYTMLYYTKLVTYVFIAYYILKSVIMYTKLRQDELNGLSDIKEIVKEEPVKKETKRKNKKIEEGK